MKHILIIPIFICTILNYCFAQNQNTQITIEQISVTKHKYQVASMQVKVTITNTGNQDINFLHLCYLQRLLKTDNKQVEIYCPATKRCTPSLKSLRVGESYSDTITMHFEKYIDEMFKKVKVGFYLTKLAAITNSFPDLMFENKNLIWSNEIQWK